MTAEPAAEALDRVFAAIGANAPAEGILQALRGIDPSGLDRRLSGRLKQASGVTLNRLGLPGEALGELHEARRLFAAAGAGADEAAVWRAIADVHSWRGDAREAALALLRAVATGEASAIAASLLDAGRLSLEIGRSGDARAFLERALASCDPTLSTRERHRGTFALARALVAEREMAGARALLGGLLAEEGTSARIRHLALTEAARIDIRQGEVARAAEDLARAAVTAPVADDTFEAAERNEVRAELALALGDLDAAAALIGGVVTRFAEDDLAGREVEARGLQATILDGIGRAPEADRTLSAALRRATARGLIGSADAIRDRLAAREGAASAGGGDEVAVPHEASGQRFVRRRPLGTGGFGSVSRAYDLESGTEVALKTLQLATTYDPTVRRERLDSARREVAATARIRHPGIGRVFGIVVDPSGEATLVREMIEGPTLEAAAKAGAAEKRAILAQLCQALAAVHSALVVHRDLKPANVVLRDGRTPVIIDFGISTAATAQREPGPFTAAYAAPEQIAGGAVDHRADLFALGLIACELLTGTLPERPPPGLWAFAARRRWRAAIRSRLAGVLPPAASDALLLALAPNPRRRLGSAADLALELQATL